MHYLHRDLAEARGAEARRVAADARMARSAVAAAQRDEATRRGPGRPARWLAVVAAFADGRTEGR
jgi:hypothetical protein